MNINIRKIKGNEYKLLNDFLYEANKEFVKQLKALGLQVQTDFVPGYTHEWRFWNLEVEKFLDWITRSDAYAASKRQV